ncbi:MAG: restriction endonuclease subunit S [Rhodanobacter sp.]
MGFDVQGINLTDGSIFETLNGLWTGKKQPFVTAGVIRNTNFTESGHIDYSDVAWLQVEQKQLAKRRLKSGDIIVERSGGGPKQPVGRVVYFDRDDEAFSFSNFTSTIRVRDPKAFDTKFVFYCLLDLYQSGRTEDIQRRTTGIRNLDFTAYKERALFPQIPLLEQQTIAGVLALMQQAIEQQERLIALTAELKKTLLHQLFTQGLRGEPQKQTEIGSVPESWEVVALGSLAKVGNGSTPKRDNKGYWQDGTIPWLNSAKIHERFVTKADQFVTDLAIKECHLPHVKPGSLLVAITGQGKTLGNTALVSFETCINQHLAYAQFTTSRVVPEFVLWFMQTRYDHLRSISQAGGSTKGALTCGYLKTYPVPVPAVDEQHEIADVFAALDRKEKVHQRKQAALTALFRTLLHQLMTAQIRVRALNLPDLTAVTMDA